MTSAALAGALLLAALPVRVESEGCPSGAEVEQALATMLPSIADALRPDLARVERRAGGLRIQLSQAQGTVIAERVLDRDGSCAELAELAAVVIASWESDVHPEFVRPHGEPGPAPVAVTSAARPSPPTAYDVALGASLAHAGSFAAGGVLALTWLPRGTGPGVRLFAALDAERSLDLGVGRAQWRRGMGGAELDWRLPRLPLDFHGGFVLGWLTATGAGFSQENLSSVSFSPAATWGARLAFWATRSFAVWVDLSGLYWTRRQTLYADPSGREQELPRLQGALTLGLALGRAAIGQ
jgi:hypothetical protein